MGAKTLMTVWDLEQIPDDDSVQIELDEGEVVRMAPASLRHNRTENRIFVPLYNFVEDHELGAVYSGDAGFVLNETTMRAPDVAFVRAARLPEVVREGFGRGSPDLAVEVVSPSDSIPQLMRKVKQYLAAGTHTVWIVYPAQQQVHVWEASGKDRILNAADALECPELLPGFSLSIAEIFA